MRVVHRALKLDPELTISRLKEIFPVARYKNLAVSSTAWGRRACRTE